MTERRKIIDKVEYLTRALFPCTIDELATMVLKRGFQNPVKVQIDIEDDDDDGLCMSLTQLRDETDSEMNKRLSEEAHVKRHHELLAIISQEDIERQMLAHLKKKYPEF